MSGDGHLDVLDRTVPLRWTQGAPILSGLLDGWEDRKTVRRISQRAGWQDALVEGTYLRALSEQTQPFRAIEAPPPEPPPVPYRELEEDTLTREWATNPGGLAAIGLDSPGDTITITPAQAAKPRRRSPRRRAS